MKYGLASFGMWLLTLIDGINDVLNLLAVTLSILVSIVGLYRQLKSKKQ